MLLHTTARYISRRLYSHVFAKTPQTKALWWSFREHVLNRFIRGETIKVELSANCNARCSFCWMFQSEAKPAGLMTLENFKKFIDINKNDFKKHRTHIQPFFNGEALVNPHFFDFIDYIVANKIPLARLDTNLGVKRDMDKLMSYPWPVICVNIGGITKEVHEKVMKTRWEIVTENLKRILQIDKSRVFIKATPVKINLHQIKSFPQFMKEMGGDPDRVEFGTTGFNIPAEATDQEIVDYFNEVVSPEVNEHLRFTYDLSKPRYDIKAKRPGCHFLNDCVTFDGKLTICCHDQLGKLNVGNSFETPLYDLKKSKKYHDFRLAGIDQKFKMCKECN